MASVKASFTFTCPKCDKVLRTSSRPAEDKKIRCPACGKPFVPELDDTDDDDDDEGTSIQAKPTLQAKPKVKANTSKTGAKKQRADEADEDDEDERPSKKKKPAKKSGGNMMLIILLVLAGGGLFVSAGACGVGAFVWPGFLVSKTEDTKIAKNAEEKKTDPPATDGNKADTTRPTADASKENKDAKDAKAGTKDAKGGTKDAKDETKKPPLKPFNNNTITDFVSPQATVLIGANTRGLRQSGVSNSVVKELEKAVPVLNDFMKPILRDAFVNADEILVSYEPANEKGMLLVAVLMPSSKELNALKSRYPIGPEEKLADRYRIHRPPPEDKNLPSLVAFPGDRLMVMGECSDEELQALMENADAKQVVPCAAFELSKSVKTSHVWGAYAFADKDRELLRVLTSVYGKQVPMAQQGLETMTRAKGANFSLTFESSTEYKLRLNFECTDADDAKEVGRGSAALKIFLNQWAAPANASFPLRSAINNSTIQAKSNTTTIGVQGSAKIVAELASLMMGPKEGPVDLAKEFPPKDPFMKDKKDGTKEIPFPQPPNDPTKKDGSKVVQPPPRDPPGKEFPKPPPKDPVKDPQPPKDGPGINPLPKSGTPLGGFELNNIPSKGRSFKTTDLQMGQSVILFSSNIPIFVPPQPNPNPNPKTKKGPPPPPPQPKPVVIDVTVEIVRGPEGPGEMVVAQAIDRGQGVRVEFTAPTTGAYRVRITNNGTTALAASRVTMFAK